MDTDVFYIYIYMRKCYSVIKMNIIMSLAVTWIDIETVILIEVSQTKTNIMILLVDRI